MAKELEIQNFIRVVGPEGGVCYGGSQMWFGRKLQVMGGCGPVAAANILATMVRSYSPGEIIPSLYDMDWQRLLELMERAYRRIRPLELPFLRITLGISSAGYFAWRLTRFADRYFSWADGRPLALVPRRMGIRRRSGRKKQNALNFIQEGLGKNCPVALLTALVPAKPKPVLACREADNTLRLAKCDRHWVTVTGCVCREGKTLLTVSTWGCLAEMDFDEWWAALNFTNWVVPCALVYFEVKK